MSEINENNNCQKEILLGMQITVGLTYSIFEVHDDIRKDENHEV
jgi:hypothetical protein